MPDAPTIVFVTPDWSPGAAPTEVHVTPDASPGAAPTVVYVTPDASPGAAPTVVHTAPSGGSIDAPSAVFVPTETAVGFVFTDDENAGRNGTYLYLGETTGGDPIYARSGDTVTLVAGALDGAGLIFRQEEIPGDGYSWALQDGVDFSSLSPSTLMTQDSPSEARTQYPSPEDVATWIGDGLEGFSFVSLGPDAPVAIFSPASLDAGDAPPSIFTPPNGSLAPDRRPTIVFVSDAISPDAELDSDGSPILDSDGYEVRDSTG